MQDVAINTSYPLFKKYIFNKYSKTIIIFDFWNESCVPCEDQHKTLKEIEDNFKEKVNIFRLDIEDEDNYEFAKNLGIKILPTLLILKNPKIFKFIGLTNYDDLSFFFNNDKNLCINCPEVKPNKSNSEDFFYCKKFHKYMYFKDSC